MNNEKVNIVEDAKSGKRLFNPILVFIFAWIMYISSVFFLYFVCAPFLYKILGREILHDYMPLVSLSSLLLSFLSTAILTFLLVRFGEGRKIRTLGFYKEHWFRNFFVGISLGFIMISVAILILASLGFVTIQNPSIQPTGAKAIIPMAILFIGFVIQGGTEEIVSRGWILNVVSAKYNKILGVFVATLYFTSCHIFNKGLNSIAVLNLILFSVFLCLYVLKTNNIWGACGLHAAWNFTQGNIFGLDVSGEAMRAGTLIDLDINGNQLLTGGTFGIESGLAITIVIIIGIVGIIIMEKKGVFK